MVDSLQIILRRCFDVIGSIGHVPSDDNELKGLKTIVTIATYMVIINLLYFSYLYHQTGRDTISSSLLLYAAYFIINLGLFRLHKNFSIIREVTFIGVYFYIITYHILLGGFIASSGYIDYGIVVVVGANIFYTKGQNLWFIIYLVTAIVLYLLETVIAKNAVPLSDSFKIIAFLNDFLMITVLVFFSIRHFTSKIREEKAKSDRLIHNILPKSIVAELKAKGASKPIMVEQATIFFVDFVGFTMTTEDMEAQQLVTELSEHFSNFDQVLSQHNVEKLKTIGDGYMGVGGLPETNHSHPVDVGCAALLILKYLQDENRKSGKAWNVRIGLHVGPMVAGIIGSSKFSYDVWGDTVNVGARMETTSQPGKINVTQEFVDQTSQFFEFEPRGLIEAKNKMPVAMYFLKGLKARFSQDGFSPNGEFYRQYESYKLTPNPV